MILQAMKAPFHDTEGNAIGGNLTDVLYNASVFKNEVGEVEGVSAL